MLTLGNEDIQIKVLPELGGAIVEAHFHGFQFMARVPKVMSQPKPLGNEIDWVRAWHGGWQPLFPNAGTEYLAGKFPQGFHGNASQSPWTIVTANEFETQLSWNQELLNCTRHIEVNSSEIEVRGSIENLAEIGREIIITEHLVLGDHFLAADVALKIDQDAYFSELNIDGSTNNLPAISWDDGSLEEWKIVTPQTPARMGVFSKVGINGVRLYSGNHQIHLTWDQDAFPYAWLWEEMKASPMEPWNNEFLALGIEPSTCEHGGGLGERTSGHVIKVLEPNEVFTWWVKLRISDERETSR